jgi:hypothetical protein
MIELKDTWLTLILKRLSKNSVEDAVIFLGFTGYSHDSLLEINCGDTVSIEFDIQMIREVIYIFGGFVEYSFFFVGFKVILLTCCLFLSLRDSWNG